MHTAYELPTNRGATSYITLIARMMKNTGGRYLINIDLFHCLDFKTYHTDIQNTHLFDLLIVSFTLYSCKCVEIALSRNIPGI